MGILMFIVGALAGAGGVYAFLKPQEEFSAEDAARAVKEAEHNAKRIREESAANLEHMKKAFAAEEKSMEESLEKLTGTVAQKEEILHRREEKNHSQEEIVNALATEIKARKEKAKANKEEFSARLSKKSGLAKEKALEEAKKSLFSLITDNSEVRMKAAIEEYTEEAPRHAKAILQVVLHRMDIPSSVDKNSTAVIIKDDKFKGMLVGKAGATVEYFESLLAVSLIFNFGSPETLHVGGVNLLRRNMGKRAIEKLQTRAKKTGAIDKEMIKIAIEESEKEVLALCDKKGEAALASLGLNPASAPPELKNFLGRLYFRTSYGQNVEAHSLEMAFASRMMAELIGANPETAALAALYHDIGKAIDHEIGGAHDDISRDLLTKYNFPPEIIHAVYAHHDKIPCETPEDFIIKAADSISGSRPGVRQESVTNYFERITQLEAAVNSFEGVSKVFAMSAGREMRVMVDRDIIADEDMEALAGRMAGKISEDVIFPGVIKVNLIRLSKSVDYARERMYK
ncbi:MAG: HD domain-containing protein [Candidatus Gracilibacteria bacterium]|jgi:ribonuclease Y